MKINFNFTTVNYDELKGFAKISSSSLKNVVDTTKYTVVGDKTHHYNRIYVDSRLHRVLALLHYTPLRQNEIRWSGAGGYEWENISADMKKWLKLNLFNMFRTDGWDLL